MLRYPATDPAVQVRSQAIQAWHVRQSTLCHYVGVGLFPFAFVSWLISRPWGDSDRDVRPLIFLVAYAVSSLVMV